MATLPKTAILLVTLALCALVGCRKSPRPTELRSFDPGIDGVAVQPLPPLDPQAARFNAPGPMPNAASPGFNASTPDNTGPAMPAPEEPAPADQPAPPTF